MLLSYKIDILATLKEKGYNTNRLRKEKLLAEGVLQSETYAKLQQDTLLRKRFTDLISTQEGRQLLNYFGRFTDWCVCNNANAEEEYAQYCSNGGKMYICAKHGFEKILRPKTTDTPLDEYGLSLICVIVGHDGSLTKAYNNVKDLLEINLEDKPLSILVEGPKGVGKTTTIKEYAKMNNLNLLEINLPIFSWFILHLHIIIIISKCI